MAKKDVLNVQEQLRKELDTLKTRVEPPSGFMISTKGKVFSLPDGSTGDGPLSVVILDWLAVNTYFEGAYNPKDVQPPSCFAYGREIVAMVPSDGAPKKQDDGKGCKKCKQNEWNSDPKGGAGKACKNTRRLLVVPADATDEAQGWVISVSPTALKHFDKYVNTLADVSTHPIEVVTEISFEESEPYPSLRFKVVDKHDNLNLMWQLKEQGQEILAQEPKIKEAA
jgi:hypothetical protein